MACPCMAGALCDVPGVYTRQGSVSMAFGRRVACGYGRSGLRKRAAAGIGWRGMPGPS